MNDSSNSNDPRATGGAHPNTDISVTHKKAASNTDEGALTSSQTCDGAGNTHTDTSTKETTGNDGRWCSRPWLAALAIQSIQITYFLSLSLL